MKHDESSEVVRYPLTHGEGSNFVPVNDTVLLWMAGRVTLEGRDERIS
jgi:hypothetical protein